MFTCKQSVQGLILGIAIVMGVWIQNSWADLLILQDTRVLRYDQDTGAFIDVFVSSGSGRNLRSRWECLYC